MMPRGLLRRRVGACTRQLVPHRTVEIDRPSFTSSWTSVAVQTLVMDPIWKMDSVVTFSPVTLFSTLLPCQ